MGGQLQRSARALLPEQMSKVLMSVVTTHSFPKMPNPLIIVDSRSASPTLGLPFLYLARLVLME